MPDTTIPQLLESALTHHKSGQLAEAEAGYRHILSLQSDHADALHLLGALAHRTGRLDEAARLINAAIAVRPGEALFYNNLALILAAQEKWEQAIAACRRAIALNGDYAEAHHSLGIVLMGADRHVEAADSIRRALALRPDHADAQFNLGRALCKIGPLDEAISVCRRAVDLRPDRIEGWCNLGVALVKAARHAQAETCYREAIRLSPDFASAYHKLAGVLMLMGQLDDAEAACRRACDLNPRASDAMCTLADILKDQGRIDEAIAGYRRSIELAPHSYINYGSFLYTLHLHPDYDTAAIFREHRAWNAAQVSALERDVQPHPNDRSPDRRLRIGYVSPHFRNQATSFFTAPLLGAHDRSHFEIYCYADVLRRDDITEMLRKRADVWRDIAALSDEQAARIIREDKIDVLIDLTMHMANGRPMLFARKPAPVQVAWLAYPGTTGLTTMDYRLTDPYLDPFDVAQGGPRGVNDAYYSEISYRLPETVLCYDPLTTGPAVNALPALREGRVTFGSLNHFAKANDQVLRMWAAVLAAVPNSRMLVLAPRGSHRRRLEDAVSAAGGNPAQVEYLERQPRQQYLEYFHQIDIVLDTFPYNGETTSLDGLWMGVPMVTLCGTTAPARAGFCYHSHLGLVDLVAKTPEQFAEIAAGLARDLPRLAELRQALRARMEKSPLMDAPRFARNVEAAYRYMWRRWCESSI